MEIFHKLKWFKRSEFANPDQLDSELLVKLDWARTQAGLPFRITSDYRARDSRTHGKGLAVDIACTNSVQRLKMVHALLNAGFTRIGIYPTHIHVDVGKNPDHVLWLGNLKESGDT